MNRLDCNVGHGMDEARKADTKMGKRIDRIDRMDR